MFKITKREPHADEAYILKAAAAQLEAPARRRFARQLMSLGGLSLLTGCAITDSESVETVLSTVSRFNDKVQGFIFDPNQMAPVYPDSMINRPFRFNAFYEEDKIPQVDERQFVLKVGGKVTEKGDWNLAALRALPQVTQVTRHICVEGWSMIGKWGGVPFRTFLEKIGADTTAKFVGFKCADDYFTSIDMPTALHAQTQLTLSFDGQVLPPKYGFPMKLRMPTKLGYKNPKHIKEIFVTNDYPGGYWEDQGYNWFGGS